MDPLSALSVAAAAAQFLDFGIKLVISARDIHNSTGGILSEYADLDKSTTSLVKLCNNLDGSLRQENTDRPLTPNDIEVRKIANECRRIGTELLAVLKELSISRNLKKWESLRLAISAQLERRHIESLVSQLQKLRQDLVPFLLGSLRGQVEASARSQLAAHKYEKAIGETFLSFVEEERHWRDDLMLAIHASHKVHDSSNPAVTSIAYSESESIRRFAKLVTNHLRFGDMKDREDTIAEAHRKTFEWIFHDPGTEQKPWSSFIDWLQSDSDIYWITGKAGSGKSTLMKYIYRDPRMVQNLNTWASTSGLVIAGFFFWNSGTSLQMSQIGLLRSLLCQILYSKPSFAASLFPGDWEMYAIFGLRPHDFSFPELRRAFRALKQACVEETKLCLFVDGLDEFDGKPTDIIDLFKDIITSPQIKICTSSRPWVVFEEEFRTVPSLRLQDLTEPDIKLFISEKFQGNSMFSEIQKHEEKFAQDLISSVSERASGVFLWVHLVVQSLLEGLSSGDRISDLQVRLDTIPGDLEGLFQKILDSIEPSHFSHASQLFQINRACRTSLEPLSLLRFYFADEYDITRAKTENITPMMEDEALYKIKIMARRLNSRCKGLLEVGNPMPDLEWDIDVGDLVIKPYAALAQPPIEHKLNLDYRPSKIYMDVSISRHSTVRYLHRSVRDWLEKPNIWEKLLTGTPTSFNAELALSKSFLLHLKFSQPAINVGEFWFLIYSTAFFAWKATDIEQVKMIMDELHRTFCQFIDYNGKNKFNRNLSDQLFLYPFENVFLNLTVYCGFDFSVEAQLNSQRLRPSLKATIDRMSPLLRAIKRDMNSVSVFLQGEADMERSFSLSPQRKADMERSFYLSPQRKADIERFYNLSLQKLADMEDWFLESRPATPSPRCVALLLEHGADPNARTRSLPHQKPESFNLKNSVWTTFVDLCVPELVSLARPLTQEGEDTCRDWFLILTTFLSHGAARTRKMDDFIEAKILNDQWLQIAFGDELKKLRLALKGNRGASRRFNFKRIFGR
ncbi:hypothetical protein B7463_g1457, partial [Scytalidium lignicola]